VWGHAVRKRKIGEGEMGWLIGRNGKEKRKKKREARGPRLLLGCKKKRARLQSERSNGLG
jgi:hypothetical protein